MLDRKDKTNVSWDTKLIWIFWNFREAVVDKKQQQQKHDLGYSNILLVPYNVNAVMHSDWKRSQQKTIRIVTW